MSSESGNGGVVLGMRRGRAVGWIIFGTGMSLIGYFYFRTVRSTSGTFTPCAHDLTRRGNALVLQE